MWSHRRHPAFEHLLIIHLLLLLLHYQANLGGHDGTSQWIPLCSNIDIVLFVELVRNHIIATGIGQLESVGI